MNLNDENFQNIIYQWLKLNTRYNILSTNPVKLPLKQILSDQYNIRSPY